MDNSQTSMLIALEQKKLEQLAITWSSMINGISHDLRTPLCTLGLIGKNLIDSFATLIEGYQLAVEHHLLESKIPEKHLTLLQESTLPDLIKTINVISKFLDLLRHLNQKILPDSPDIQLLTISTCMENVIKKYPFIHNKDKALLKIKMTPDFKFICASVFIEQLISNLLDNALHHIDQAGNGQINIWTEEEESHYVLHFQDTLGVMDQDVLGDIFSRFFSKRDNNVVPGLGFCRLALLQRGGDIICHVTENQYTDFMIKFAKEVF